MLKDAITYLNSVLTATGYFDENYGLAELVRRVYNGTEQRFPAVYTGQNDYDKITDFDKRNGVSYWRLRSTIAQTDVRVPTISDPIQSRTYPLKLVVNTKRSNLHIDNDNAYTEDKFSLSIQKSIRNQEKTLRQNLNAYRVTMTFGEVVTDANDVINAEFIEVSSQKRSKYLFMSIDVDLTIEIPKSCIANFTDTDVAAPSALTASAGSSSITLSWTDNSSNETSFQVFRSTSVESGWTKIANVAADTTTYEDSTVVTDTTYFYKVRSCLSNVVSSFSNIAGGKVVSSVCDDGSVTIGSGGDTIASDVPSGGVKALEFEDQNENSINSEVTTDGEGTVAVQIYNTANTIKTGQTTSYATYDDGDEEFGRLANWSTLDQNNVFGNTNRFTDEEGEQTYANSIMIDNSTEDKVNRKILGWYMIEDGPVSWGDALTNSNGVITGGFTNWRVPNTNQLWLVSHKELAGNGLGYSPLNYTTSRNVWSSTTYNTNTDQAYRLLSNGQMGVRNKTEALTYGFYCRYFTYAELGL